ncbi:MAG: TlpA disulfide reductase family protein [Paludisphaera borealis]|uniref:TlpA family protein disulfide reductase n=1 Tax=Paludisphaera borealis TaxID=1387353 RepID=UPI002848E2B7|nr:TlpA disulfide reductase family protein [Paludisphaera borealis]MDR3621612.1 TlpA disulfide reductase family protein [Paludisphaera borealis]
MGLGKTLLTMGLIAAAAVQAIGQATPAGVAEIQSRHDRALVRELSEYLMRNPKADDRDQAYAALFNKAIEHDWFAENEESAKLYLKNDPDGPVKALAQIISVMARAQAGQFNDALARYKELMLGLGKSDQVEFASSFTETFAASAVTAGEVDVARQIYQTVGERFPDSTELRDKVARELARLDRVGKPAPSLEVQDLSGKTVRLASLRGKYVLVDFWATWCAPCIAELPRQQEAYRKYHDAGLEVVGVSLDETRSAVVDFVKVRKLPWAQFHNGTAGADLVEAFGVSSIPANYLIDPEGNIVRLDLRGAALDAVLAKLIKRGE